MLTAHSVSRRAELVERLLDEGSELLIQLPSPEREKLGMELLGSAELPVSRSPLANLLWEEWKCFDADVGMSGMPTLMDIKSYFSDAKLSTKTILWILNGVQIKAVMNRGPSVGFRGSPVDHRMGTTSRSLEGAWNPTIR